MGCYGRFFGAIVVAVVLVMVPTGVSCHGRLMDPPQRSSMWRLGFNVPTNYDDNALFCGGFMVILFLSLNLTAPNVFFKLSRINTMKLIKVAAESAGTNGV